MKTESTLQVLDLKKIKISNTNPRKTFDENSLKELSESIKGKGVLQPILVRPYGKAFKLVCGERRYRAATMAGLETIPANIRELTDDEAFEMQIVENLERKDVHPMEEAEAFKRMLDSGKYEIADIAAKMAKPESFITQRLKLVDLIDEIKQDFFDGKLGVGHAIKLARISKEQQKDIHHSAHNGWYPGYGTVNDIENKIKGDLFELSKAHFDTKDPDLVKGICSCEVCPKRSGANPKLFADIKEDDICFDSTCYNTKLSTHIEKKIASIVVDGSDLLLGKGYSDAPEQIEEMCKSHGIKLLKVWDDYREVNGDENDARNLLLVAGYEAGKMIKVHLTEKAKSKTSDEADPIEDQIFKIESRAKRALELDDEKVWKNIREMDAAKFTSNSAELSNNEKLALVASIWENSWHIRENMEWMKDMNVEKIYTEPVPDSVVNHAVRLFIYEKLNNSYGSHTTHIGNAALKQVLEEYYQDEINAFADEQQEAAEKRIARTNERLEKLKSQLKAEK